MINFLRRIILQKKYKADSVVLQELKKIPRYTSATVSLENITFQLVDSASFIFQYKEIFQRQIYNFSSETSQPYIIDCGANIGLSVIYFKQLYPGSRIVAFEPDPDIFTVLKQNISRYGCVDIELMNKAVWTENAVLEFLPDRSDGGRVVHTESAQNLISVSAVRLANYLKKPVDFLKIDIEGAELAVVQSCQNNLKNVKHLFIEYHSFTNEKQHLYKLLAILSAAKFRVHIEPISITRQPFIRQRFASASMDMQLNIFAVREL